ncbi:MAG: YbaK/EbsC family protein [Planctomycetota bacterium]|jgi:prolyl-tRNA editing enzyme YbaK/EbsC (Cys-tRNA(Pro) deacylase)|nr:YbaK/EbsC family protein [Planctomycetota bacterium]
MSVETVKTHLAKYMAGQRIRFMPELTATVELAAAAIGVEPARIAKTLAIRLKGGGDAVILVMKGTARLDNAKFKARFGTKPIFIRKEECQALTGHPPGGVCPFGLPPDLPVYLDQSLREFDRLFPAAGSVDNFVDASPEELERWTGGEWVDVCV